MKSDIIKLSGDTKDNASLKAVLSETEKTAEYAELDKKQEGRLRLLAEELINMLPEVLEFSSGEFWIDCSGKQFEMHTSLTPDVGINSEKRDELLKLSKSGKNAAAVGIMSKIRLAVTFMLLDPNIYQNSFMYLGADPTGESLVWTLDTFRKEAKEKKGEAWDELEKSIIGNIADDVLVGVEGKRVEIVVKKTF